MLDHVGVANLVFLSKGPELTQRALLDLAHHRDLCFASICHEPGIDAALLDHRTQLRHAEIC